MSRFIDKLFTPDPSKFIYSIWSNSSQLASNLVLGQALNQLNDLRQNQASQSITVLRGKPGMLYKKYTQSYPNPAYTKLFNDTAIWLGNVQFNF